MSFKLLPSSFITDLDYDQFKRTVRVQMHHKKWYEYGNISPNKFLRFMTGRAVCVTNDPTGRNRWYRGKSKSMGAFYNQFIKLGGIKRQISRVTKANVHRITNRRVRRLNKLINRGKSVSQAIIELDEGFEDEQSGKFETNTRTRKSRRSNRR